MAVPVQAIYKQYLDIFPQEAEELSELQKQLDHKGDEDIANRNAYDAGHLTSAALIVSLPSKRALVLEHQVYKKLLQPGGHVEPEDESIVAAAYREAEEEAGILASELTYLPLTEQNNEIPLHIGVHEIPERPSRGEPLHYHYDFQYLFTVRDDIRVRADSHEASSHQWVTFQQLAELPGFSRQAEKIEKLLL